MAIMHAFIDGEVYAGLSLDQALRKLLAQFRQGRPGVPAHPTHCVQLRRGGGRGAQLRGGQEEGGEGMPLWVWVACSCRPLGS